MQGKNIAILWNRKRIVKKFDRHIEKLTPHEARVLVLLVAGLSNQQIADKTSVSVNTVKYHLKNLYSKIGATGRTHAARRANELGLFVWRENGIYINQAALLHHIHQPVGSKLPALALENSNPVLEET